MKREHDFKAAWPSELSLTPDADGPAFPVSDQQTDSMIAAALEQAWGPEQPAHDGELESTVVPLAPRTPVREPARASMGTRVSWQVAAAGLLALLSVGSASAALMWLPREAATVSPSKAAVSAAISTRPRANLAPVAPVAEAQPAEVDAKELAVEVDAPVAPSRAPRATTKQAEDWLNEANRLRRSSRWQAADQMYTRVFQGAPDSQAAYVARIAAASIRLEHRNDPQGALVAYRAALVQSPRGALNEEARFGVAEVYRKLGRAEAERQALAAFLREHADSALAARARARLASLSGSGSGP
jgi:tetratricopeptide (TPR) repeat protein